MMTGGEDDGGNDRDEVFVWNSLNDDVLSCFFPCRCFFSVHRQTPGQRLGSLKQDEASTLALKSTFVLSVLLLVILIQSKKKQSYQCHFPNISISGQKSKLLEWDVHFSYHFRIL